MGMTQLQDKFLLVSDFLIAIILHIQKGLAGRFPFMGIVKSTFKAYEINLRSYLKRMNIMTSQKWQFSFNNDSDDTESASGWVLGEVDVWL